MYFSSATFHLYEESAFLCGWTPRDPGHQDFLLHQLLALHFALESRGMTQFLFDWRRLQHLEKGRIPAFLDYGPFSGRMGRHGLTDAKGNTLFGALARTDGFPNDVSRKFISFLYSPFSAYTPISHRRITPIEYISTEQS